MHNESHCDVELIQSNWKLIVKQQIIRMISKLLGQMQKSLGKFCSGIKNPEVVTGIILLCSHRQIVTEFQNYPIIGFWLLEPGDD
jgi:hypothetical protein